MLTAYITTTSPKPFLTLPAFDEDIEYPRDIATRQSMRIPSSLQEAINMNPFTKETIEIDEATGLIYYYP
jgi:hypothetical protein